MYEIFSDLDVMLNKLNILLDKYETLIKIIKACTKNINPKIAN